MARPSRTRPFRPARFLPDSLAGYGLLAYIIMGTGITYGDLMIVAGRGTGSSLQQNLGSVVMIGSPLLAIALMVVGHYKTKRDSIPPGHCLTCGYNLTGNISGRCPECGTPIKVTGPKSA